MALTPSNMLPLGTPAPDFSLPDTVSGRLLSWADVAGTRGTVVMFLCNHCPYVKLIEADLPKLAADFQERGIGFVAISSNDAEAYPQDGPEAMAENATRLGYPFPYLYDQSQEVAKAYQAACTPDFYLFDAAALCVYRGQYDDARPGNGKAVTGADLRAAIQALLDGRPIPSEQTPSVGCNIKWRAA